MSYKSYPPTPPPSEALYTSTYSSFFLSIGVEYFRHAFFGEGASSSPIFLDLLECQGDEDTLLSCGRSSPLGVHQCVHSEDAGVRCKGKPGCSVILKQILLQLCHFVFILLQKPGY